MTQSGLVTQISSSNWVTLQSGTVALVISKSDFLDGRLVKRWPLEGDLGIVGKGSGYRGALLQPLGDTAR